MSGPQHFDCVVVGGGMSGLAYAWTARQRGRRVVLLEAGARAGGVIQTETREGFRIERAATSVPSTASHLLDLLATLPEPPALEPARPAANAQYLANRGGLHRVPRSPGALFRNARIPWNAKARAISEVVRPRRAARGLSRRPETAYEFVRRRFGTYVAERFLRPFTNGIYGAAPERLGAADAFPRLVAAEARRGSVIRGLARGRGAKPRDVLLPRGGMQSIPRALGNALGNRMHTLSPVESIRAGSASGPARVVTADGVERIADELVLAVGAQHQARLIEPHSKALSQTLGSVRYVPMVVASVGYAAGDGPALPEAFGFLRGTAPLRILGATFNSRISNRVVPDGHELLTVYLGGSEDRDVVRADTAWIRKRVLRDLTRVFRSTIRPALFDVKRWPRAIPMFTPGHRGRMARVAWQLEPARIRLLGSHITGVSIDDCCRPR